MVLGVILILLSSAAQNGSAVLLAIAARSNSDRTGPSLIVDVARRWQGFAGMALNTIGWILELAALTYITLTLDRIIVTAGFGLVIALSHYFLKEPVGWRELAGAALIAVGIVAVGVMPVGRSNASPTIIGWLVIVAVLVPTVLAPSAMRLVRIKPAALVCAASAGFAYALTGMFTKGLSDMLSLKDILSLLGLLAGVGIVDTLGFTNELFALKQERASAAVPMIAALREIVPIIMAPFFFAESWPPILWKQLIMGFGILLNVVGVIILSRSPANMATAKAAAGKPPQAEIDLQKQPGAEA